MLALNYIALAGVVFLSGCAAYVGNRADQREAQARAAFPPMGQFVEVDGTRIHAFVTGTGPDLVLLHGASGNLRDFTFGLVDDLKSRYRIYAFDRPGLGYSDRADPAFIKPLNSAAESPAQQAAILSRAATLLGAKRPIVLGHSYGGAVAMAWGLDEPAAALVILGGASMPWPGDLGTQYAVLGSGLGGAIFAPSITAFVKEDQIAAAVQSIFAPQPVPDGYLDHIGPGLSLDRQVLRANARQVNSLRPHIVEMSARYETLDLPVELVHGDADTIVPLVVHSAPLSEQLPNATLTVLPGVGHMPQHTNSQDVIDAIDRAARRAGLR